ncbi:U-Kazal-Dg21.2-like [Rhodnius prolixus]|uniref:Kazal-like domain-containing protein n=1 Tax=Rhodnius prolixus TaxID=13249 RepID=T1ID42_RHOPR
MNMMLLFLVSISIFTFSLGTEIIQPKPGCNKICPKVWLPICAFAPGPSEFRTFGSRCEMENENCECNHIWRQVAGCKCNDIQRPIPID